MLHVIANISEKLVDPILAKEMLHTLSALEVYDPTAALNSKQDWFRTSVIKKLLDTEDFELLNRLFHDIPVKQFRGVLPTLIDRWTQWPDLVAKQVAIVIVKLSPEHFIGLANQFLNSHLPQEKYHRMYGIISSISELPTHIALPLIDQILNQVETNGSLPLSSFYAKFFNAWVKATCLLKHPKSMQLLSNVMKNDHELVSRLETIYETITQDKNFFVLAENIYYGETEQTFQSMRLLFNENAPLETIDDLLTDDNADVWSDAITLLEQLKTTDRALQFFQSFLIPLCAQMPEEKRSEGWIFSIVALVACAYKKAKYDFASLELADLMQLAAFDLEEPDYLDELVQRLSRLPRTAVIIAMENAFAAAPHFAAEDNLIKLMGFLSYSEFVSTLLSHLTTDHDHSNCENTKQALFRSGQHAKHTIINRWNELDDSQKIDSLKILAAMQDAKAADFLMQFFSKLTSENVDLWCQIALTVPDKRYLTLLEPELKRQQPSIDATFYMLSLLFDYPHAAIETLRNRILDRQQENNRWYDENFDIFAPQKNLTLELHCSACGISNLYPVENVYVSPKYTNAKPWIGGDIACMSCGQCSDLEVTTKAINRINAEILKLTLATMSQNVAQYNTPIKFMTAKLWNGKQLAPSEAIHHYQKILEKNPNHVPTLLSLANCYSHMHCHQRAQQYYQQCYALDPHCIEAVLAIAMELQQQNDSQKAFFMLDTALKNKDQWRFYRLINMTPTQFGQQFAESYNELLDEMQLSHLPRLHSHFLSSKNTTIQKSKLGRNDPCYCGSGKKYKKCCLNV